MHMVLTQLLQYILKNGSLYCSMFLMLILSGLTNVTHYMMFYISAAPLHFITLLGLHLVGHASCTQREAPRAPQAHPWQRGNKCPHSRPWEWYGNAHDCWSCHWRCTAGGHISILVPLCLEVSLIVLFAHIVYWRNIFSSVAFLIFHESIFTQVVIFSNGISQANS